MVFFLLIGGSKENFVERLNKTRFSEYLSTVDHKKIGLLYLFTGLFFFVLGGIEAGLIRLQLFFPTNNFFVGESYNRLFTMHGTTMIFLAAMPLLFGLMNFIVPLQIGARDVAFPFLNSLSFWLFFFGGLLLNLSWFFGDAPSAGWTSYTTLALKEYSKGVGVDYYSLGLQISGIGTLISSINFIVTIINMRTKGISLLRMPLFTWTTLLASVLMLFAFPAFTVALLLLMLERLFGFCFFKHSLGGSSVIWQHLFWIFGHPEVYIVILPAFGIMSEVISNFSKKRLFGYASMVFATIVIGFLGFMVWVHHMFTVGLGPFSNSIFALATMTIAVPTGIKIFNWLFTMWQGEIHFTTPMLFALGFIPTFVMGGMTGVMLALPPADFQYQDTYFVIAHFHYTLIGGTVLGLFAGIYYWWPKMFGKLLNETLGKIHFFSFILGFHLTFFPQHFLGLFGMPRRVFTYEKGTGLEFLNILSSIGVIFMAVGILAFILNIILSFKKGKKAPNDPWYGRTLEWFLPSPPLKYNFPVRLHVKAYDPFWFYKEGFKVIEQGILEDIHMPSPSYLPFLISLSLFVAGFGFIFGEKNSYLVGFLGLFFVVICLFIRSFKEDEGFYIRKEELAKELGSKI